MEVNTSEKEQLEALRKWWKENGSSLITGLLLGLSALVGTKAWFSYQENRALNASNVYAQMMVSWKQGEIDRVRGRANELIGNYSGSGYAPLAALLLAKIEVHEDQLPAAHAQLQWALEHADTPELRNTARVRLIRTMIAEGQYDQARQLLASVKDAGAYDYLYSELRGDLALAEGKPQEAAKAYREALDAMPEGSPARGFLNVKYDNVAAGSEATK
ncbi:MAG TPA: tetratricopeptide repeat protein [Gammaproteobacteria bacterium]|nr:tetratricopeptide repeat protein [Gammaproteobacteria bacterium]